jgi:anti-sigma-K factor RskA
LLIGTAIYTLNIRSQAAMEETYRQRIEAALQKETAQLASIERQIAGQERALAGLQGERTQRLTELRALRASLSRRENEAEHLLTRAALRERQVVDLTLAVAQRDEIVTFLRSPRMKVVSLAGLEMAKSAGAFLLFDPDTRKAFFYAFNMPPLMPGKVYQLWAIVVDPSGRPVTPGDATGTPRNGFPVSAGTFDTDAGQKSRLLIQHIPADIGSIKTFVVSLEPEGGRPQPTGDIYLAGQL